MLDNTVQIIPRSLFYTRYEALTSKHTQNIRYPIQFIPCTSSIIPYIHYYDSEQKTQVQVW